MTTRRVGSRSTAARRVGLAIGWSRYIFPTLWALLILVPLVTMFLGSFRTLQDYVTDPRAFPVSPTFANYGEAWANLQLAISFFNSSLITVLSVVGVVLVGSLAAYGIARWRGRFGLYSYAFFALGLIVPVQLGLPALYKMWVQAGLVDTLAGVIIIHIGTGLPIAIFLYAGFLLTVPLELEEAARIDGASDFRVYRTIVFPLLNPVHATVIILSSIGVWNDLLVSIFFLQSKENLTPPRSMLVLQSQYANDIPVIYASAVIVVVPILILFFILQRAFVSGLTSGALKG